MICSHIENEDYIFIQLHAEQSYTNVELYKKYSLGLNNALSNIANESKSAEDCEEREINNIQKGVFGKRLTGLTLVNLRKHIEDLNSNSKVLVVNFKQLISAQKNIFKTFHEILNHLLDKNFTVILKNIEGSLSEDLNLEVFTEKK